MFIANAVHLTENSNIGRSGITIICRYRGYTQIEMDPHLKIDVSSASGSSAVGVMASTSEAPHDAAPQQAMPPPTVEWNNQFNSPEAVSPKTNGTKCFSPYSQEDMGPFVEQLLPFVRASAYNWFHLQAAKRRYIKEFDKKMSASEENKKLADLQTDRDELKVKWASRLLSKIKKDIQSDHKDAFISVINGNDPNRCILSVADQKGKMRRIDCLRQADKVWRLDLVTIILFKGIPLESTDGERLERCETCTDFLCINPFHMSISVRGLDIFMANYLKDVDTKITLTYGSKDEKTPEHTIVKQEPGEQAIVAPHAVLATSSTHARVWETNASNSSPETVVLTYDPQKACHTYFGGRATLVQQSAPNAYTYFVNKNAVDNNYYDSKRSVLCLPPPSPQSLFSYPVPGTSDSQQLEMSEDSNDGPSEKRSRDMSSHDSPNSSTNDEVRRIVESGTETKFGEKLVLGSSIWSAPAQFSRVPSSQGASNQNRPVRQFTDFRNHDPSRTTAFRAATKSVRRMTVNTGNLGDVGVVVVDERTHQDPSSHAQNLVNALNSLCTTPTMRESPAGRKRVHPNTDSPFEFLNCNHELLKESVVSGNEISPSHTAVSNFISREGGGYMASPTKFTTARGDTTSFSKILQKIEEKHGHHNQPSTSYHIQPPILSSKPVDSSIKLIAPVPLKPTMMPLSACNSIIPSPITTPRITPFRMIDEDSLINALGQLSNSNDGTLNDNFMQHFIDVNSRSPLNGGVAFSALSMGAVSGLVPVSSSQRPDSSASNLFSGSNSLGAVMGLTVPQTLALAVSQTPTAMSPLNQIRMGAGIPSACSPSSSNSSLGAANQAPVSNVPKDPNAPKLPTDFSQALRNE